MPKPICMTCKKFYRPKKNGVVVEEGMPIGYPTMGVSTKWESYKLWRGDLWECHQCGHQIVVGFGNIPMAEHYEPHYAKAKRLHPPIAFIEDC